MQEKKRHVQEMIEFASGLDYKFSVHHKNDEGDFISQLCDKYGSDKGEQTPVGHPYPWPSHSFAYFYSRLFAHCRYKVNKVFECGLGTNNPNIASSMGVKGRPGASLRVWRDFFPNAIIIGGDIDRNVLFDEERIHTFYIDQLDPAAISSFWDQVGIDEFDLMLDDGLHTFEAGSCLFEHSISKLAADGIYIIEDVQVRDLIRYKQFFDKKGFVVDYVNMFRPNVELGNNSLVVIRKRPVIELQMSA
jgi:hypothetical protein